METFLGIAAIPAITVISYLIGMAGKALPLPDKWIPVACGITGGALGVPAMKLIAGFPAGDPISAVAVGIVSGLAATAVNQVYKQFTKDE